MKIAVFGHYDSRGGTSAIRLPDNPTEADIQAAIKRYDRDLFGIEEPGDRIETTAYGMEARECDKMVHDMMYQDTTPGVEDFMYVAELHGADDLEGDLEEVGTVLMDGAERGGLRNEALQAWYRKVETINATKTDPTTHYQTYLDLESERPADWTTEERIEKSLKEPVQLEFVEAKYDYRVTEMEPGVISSSDWTAEMRDEAERRGRAEEERIEALAKHVPGAKYTRWDDDAYGFILM